STTRVVLDATGVSHYSVYPLYNPYRLVIDCERARPTAPATLASSVSRASTPRLPISVEATTRRVPARDAVKPPLAGRVVRADWNRTLPVSVPRGSAALDEALRVLPSREVD